MKEKSLHQIMNDIVGRLDTLELKDQSDSFAHLKPRHKAKKKSKDPLSEIQAFMKLDDLLAHLHKQYLEAKLQCQALVKEHGSDDPMAEIAMDMEDSAYCAFQTRYMELREVRELMAKAQRLMRERKEEIAFEKAKEREQKFKNFILLAKAQQELRERNQRGGFEWAVLLLIFNLVPQPPQCNRFIPGTNLKAA